MPQVKLDQFTGLFHRECLIQDLRVSKQALQARLDQISYSHQGFKVVKDRLY